MSAPPPLSMDLDSPAAVPYFLWDEPMTIRELRDRLANRGDGERIRLLAKILREARDTHVWRFTNPREVAERWADLAPRLGRRRGFWELLLRVWREEGLLDAR